MSRKIIPLDNEFLPPVGADLELWAEKNNTDVSQIIKLCLYHPGGTNVEFSRDKVGTKKLMQVLPGHRWYHDKKKKSLGVEPCDYMIIGKCLNNWELSNQRHLCGTAGDYLAEELTLSGFGPDLQERTFVTSIMLTTQLESEKNSIPAHWKKSQAHLLWQQILLVKPKICLLQGVDAVKAVLGSKFTLAKLDTQVEERTYSYTAEDGEEVSFTVKFVASVHPNSVIHDRRKAGSNIRTHAEQRLHRQLNHFNDVVSGKGPGKTMEDYEWELIKDTEKLAECLKEATENAPRNLVAWDAEWQGDHPQNDDAYLRCVQFTHSVEKGYVIALTNAGGEPCFKRRDANGEWTTEGAFAECMKMCETAMQGKRVVGHYFTADMEWLTYHGCDLRPMYDAASSPDKVQDEGGVATELMAHAWDETALFSLDDQLLAHTTLPKYSEVLDTFKKEARAELHLQLKRDLASWRESKRRYNKESKRLRSRVQSLNDQIGRAATMTPGLKKKVEQINEIRGLVQQARTDMSSLAEEKPKITLKYQQDLHAQKTGYGWIPDDILYPYAAWDVSAELELAFKYLDYIKADRYGNDCTTAYWISHRAALAVLEINCTGLRACRRTLDDLAEAFTARRDELLQKVRDYLCWPNFNPRSKFEFAEALFGEELNGNRQQYGKERRTRPGGAKTIRAVPLRTTGKYPMEWSAVLAEGKELDYSPDTKKQSLGEMFHTADKLKVRRYVNGAWRIVEEDCTEIIGLLRDYRVIDQALKQLVRPPITNTQGENEKDDEGFNSYDAGLATLICGDGKVRTRMTQTKETGRWASRGPAMQNLSKSREADLARILNKPGTNVSARAIFVPDDACHDKEGNEDWFLVEADYSGAELMMAAIMSQDEDMIDHCQRNLLPDDHPDFFDIHSNITVQAFKFDCAPTKAGLKSVNASHLRTVGKSVVFGSLYGRGPGAIAVAVKEEGVFVTKDEAAAVQRAFFDTYPKLEPFFSACRNRVTSPGWMCNMFGRFRRFPHTDDEKKRKAYEREAMNTPMQGGVADAMSMACRNLLDHAKQHDMKYKVVLTIHDAVFLHVPASEMMEVIKDGGVLKKCMVHDIPLIPTDLNGNYLPAAKEYRFGSSIDIYGAWGKDPPIERFVRNGLCPSIGGYKKNDSGEWE